MIFGEGERRRTIRTSSENLTKSAEIAAFWQGSFYSCLAYRFGADKMKKSDLVKLKNDNYKSHNLTKDMHGIVIKTNFDNNDLKVIK